LFFDVGKNFGLEAFFGVFSWVLRFASIVILVYVIGASIAKTVTLVLELLLFLTQDVLILLLMGCDS